MLKRIKELINTLGFEQSLVNQIVTGINNMLESFKDNKELSAKIIYSIELILVNNVGDYVCAFSGGKDSMVLKYLTDISGVPHITIFNKTSVDPKELLDYIKEYHPDVQWIFPKKTMFKAIEDKGYPTRLFRHCCQILKHYSYPENTKLIGIRSAESTSRSRRKEVEVNRESKTKKMIISPIFWWTDDDVWNFINTLKLPYCKLYETQKRIGCILCPMQTKKNLEEDIKNYPKFVKAYKFAGNKHLEKMKAKGREISFHDGDDYFNWWISGLSIAEYLDNRNANEIVNDYITTMKPIINDGKIKVFSCFSGPGGSSIGYKNAGCNVIAALDIDKRFMEIYIANNEPTFIFTESISDFKLRKNIPKELYNIDILDGSFPCSSFSLIGNRDKDWGKEKSFKEGQKKQILDTLAFDFIETAKILTPKVIIMENVKGLIQGKAKKYYNQIIHELILAGYIPQTYVLNAADMDVPQNRERVFIISVRKDLMKYVTKDGLFGSAFKLNLKFNNPHIPFSAIEDVNPSNDFKIYPFLQPLLPEVKEGECFGSVHFKLYGKKKYYSYYRVSANKPINTITANEEHSLFHYKDDRPLSNTEIIKASTFPLDYNFKKKSVKMCCGLAVPPKMMENIMNRIKVDLHNVFFNEFKKGRAKTLFGEIEVEYDDTYVYMSNGEKYRYVIINGKLQVSGKNITVKID